MQKLQTSSSSQEVDFQILKPHNLRTGGKDMSELILQDPSGASGETPYIYNSGMASNAGGHYHQQMTQNQQYVSTNNYADYTNVNTAYDTQ